MNKIILSFFVIALVTSCAKKKDATNSPEFVMNQIKTAVEAADTKALSTLLCKKDQNIINAVNTIGGAASGTVGKFVANLIKKQLANSHQLNFDNVRFRNEKISDNSATLESTNSKTGKQRIHHFVKEDGVWRLCI